jgi:NAD+ kinase
VSALQRLLRRATELKLKVVSFGETARLLPQAVRVAPDRFARRIDALIALGGDGTMLHAAHLLRGSDTPVLGVNLGNLGFLTSVTESELERGLDIVARGGYEISIRAMAECAVYRHRKKLGVYRALNDIVVGWGRSTRIITLGVALDDEQITSYRCDGLIVSTPTGTTAHSLSAGGPILHPVSNVLLINVLCPHTLSARPIVVPDRSVITVTVTETPKTLLLSVDGQNELPVRQGDRLVIRRSPQSIRFIHLPGYSYFAVLRHKLQWRGSSLQRG